ncbi:MAG: molybdopterin-guanine dinucleotide biosynthesis protein B [Chloroflexi bacterium]|nr:molybdopterin-guanine dinucleotide biosynthesis protein B [Chloroflexota bacterium]
MRPIISVVGKSDSGKTSLLERLIAELKQRGHKVAAIKHTDKDLEFDTAGKNSWRLGRAGSEVVALASPHQVAIMKQVERDLSPQELSRLIAWDYDLILTEGFKKANTPKIEVHRREQGQGLLCPPEQLLAVVTDEPLDVNVPQFSRDEVNKLADLIEGKLRTWREEGGPPQ